MSLNLWENIIVQERAKLALEKIFYRNAYPPALIFFGQIGVGKEAHALAFAQSINCENKSFNPCGKCDRCKNIFNLLNPDIYLIYPVPTSSSERNSSIKRIEQFIEKKNLIHILKFNYLRRTKLQSI